MTHPTPFPNRPAPIFTSRHHPGAAGLAATFARAYARPLPVALLPLMIAALAVALQGGNVMPFLTVFFPLALGATALWTAFWLGRRIVEVQTAPHGVCLRTAWEVARSVECRWRAVHGLRYAIPWLTFAWGRTAIELDETEWPEAPLLLDALRSAAADYRAEPV